MKVKKRTFVLTDDVQQAAGGRNASGEECNVGVLELTNRKFPIRMCDSYKEPRTWVILQEFEGLGNKHRPVKAARKPITVVANSIRIVSGKGIVLNPSNKVGGRRFMVLKTPQHLLVAPDTLGRSFEIRQTDCGHLPAYGVITPERDEPTIVEMVPVAAHCPTFSEVEPTVLAAMNASRSLFA